MSFHRFLSVDLVTGTIRDEVPLSSVTFGKRLNGAAPFTATANVHDPKITPSNLDPARTLIVVERNGKIVGDGIVWTPNAKRQGDDRIVEVTGASLWSYLDRRRIREDRTYVDVDNATILADLVDWTQGAGSTAYGPSAGDPTGDVGIDTSGVAASGTTSDRTYPGDERKRVGEAMSQFGAVEDVDASVDVRWDGDELVRELLVRPSLGRDLADPFVLGGNVRDYELVTRGDLAESHVDAIGQGEGETMLVRTAADPSAHPAYPRLDGVEPLKDVSRPATLTRHAQERLSRHRRPVKIPTLTLDPDGIPTFGSWELRDRARCVIDDGYAQVDGIYQIVEWAMTITSDGDESLKLTVAVPDQ